MHAVGVLSIMSLVNALQKALDASKNHRNQTLAYTDMPGRAASYMTRGRLPPIFLDLDRWPTHAPGKSWTIEVVLDILSQTFDTTNLHQNISHAGARCFQRANLPHVCMVARKASSFSRLCSKRVHRCTTTTVQLMHCEGLKRPSLKQICR